MKKGIILTFAFLNVTLSIAQEKLVGSWSLVSIDNIYPDSSRVHPYGENPKGLLIFDANGNYAIQILKAVRSKIVSGDKNTCTAEENATLVQGSNSHFGKYEMDEEHKIMVFKIESASFPNWEGTTQKRSYIRTENEIKYVVTNTTQGGQSIIAEVVWRKL
ncbi:lipocalin-like domain-containing protein [Flavobacterium sp. XS2P39]|uniref:lipocalin-like domain-containing protein n=1 Tax=Flavobacterium sp. XS2P39 TaxID=3401725 RepID=UPI003AB03E40